jgi:hypothetical protein
MAGFFKGVLMSPFVLVAVAFLIERPWLLLLPAVFVVVGAIVTSIQAGHESDMKRLRRTDDDASARHHAPIELVLTSVRPVSHPLAAARPRRRVRR